MNKIRVDLFDQAVELLANEVVIENWALTKTSEENFKRNFGNEIGEFFITHSYSSGWRFGKNNFDQVRHLHKENFKSHNKGIHTQGYYIIGRGLSEDLIVLNCNTGTIGYVNSSKFYDVHDNTAIEDAFVDTHLDLGSFYYNSITEGEEFMGRAIDVPMYLAKKSAFL